MSKFRPMNTDCTRMVIRSRDSGEGCGYMVNVNEYYQINEILDCRWEPLHHALRPVFIEHIPAVQLFEWNNVI